MHSYSLEKKKGSLLPFWLKKAQSLSGVFLVLFIIEHLFTNAQSSLWLGKNGQGFIELVDTIHSFTYLKFIEIIFLAFPILLHTILGIYQMQKGKINIYSKEKTTPSLPNFERNIGYTLQRVSAILLLFLILFHVIQMRFISQPQEYLLEDQLYYRVKIEHKALIEEIFGLNSVEEINGVFYFKSDNFGSALLATLRDTMRSWHMKIFYTLFSIIAIYHAFNGLWSAFIGLGLLLTQKVQQKALLYCRACMGFVFIMAILAIFGD